MGEEAQVGAQTNTQPLDSGEIEQRNFRFSESKFERLKKALDFQTSYYRRGAHYNRRWALRFKVVLILLAFTTTVLLGLKLDANNSAVAKQWAFVLSAIVTALTALDGLFDFSGNWIRKRAVYLRIIQLRANFQYAFSEPVGSQETLDRHWRELQELLEDEYKARIEALTEAGGQDGQ